jgi:cytochrome P450
VIKETKRLHPSSVYQPRQARADFLVREYDIPAGTAVDISQNRDLDVWGPDGDKF